MGETLIGFDSPNAAGECRICGETASSRSNPLISPCACRGTIAKVHVQCLQRWIESRPDQHSLQCETCGVSYRVVYERRLVYDCKHLCCNATSCYHATDFVMLLVTLGCVCFMTIIIVPRLKDQGESESSVIVIYVLSGLLLAFALFTLQKVWRRWHTASSVPTLIAEDYCPSVDGNAIVVDNADDSRALVVAVNAPAASL